MKTERFPGGGTSELREIAAEFATSHEPAVVAPRLCTGLSRVSENLVPFLIGGGPSSSSSSEMYTIFFDMRGTSSSAKPVLHSSVVRGR